MCLPAARPAANSRHSTVATKGRKSSIWNCRGKLLKLICPEKELSTKAEHSLEEEEEEEEFYKLWPANKADHLCQIMAIMSYFHEI